jgi:hypothetical protein
MIRNIVATIDRLVDSNETYSYLEPINMRPRNYARSDRSSALRRGARSRVLTTFSRTYFFIDQGWCSCPARIRQLRGKAAARGLDPNKWFNNVEVVAAESIGRETVQYVSNVHKYYLAYQMTTEHMKERSEAKKSAR